MATNKDYLDYILEQLSGLEDITWRKMMGEYLLYYRGKLVGGLYDDRFLVKPVEAARTRIPGAVYEPPYDGAKAMLLVEDVDDRAFLEALITAMFEELPAPRAKNKRAKKPR